MREIAAFLGPDDFAAMMFEGAAHLDARLTADRLNTDDLGRTLLRAIKGR